MSLAITKKTFNFKQSNVEMLNFPYAMITANRSLFDIIRDLVVLIKDGDSNAYSVHSAMLIAFYKTMIHLCSGDVTEDSLVSIPY